MQYLMRFNDISRQGDPEVLVDHFSRVIDARINTFRGARGVVAENRFFDALIEELDCEPMTK